MIRIFSLVLTTDTSSQSSGRQCWICFATDEDQDSSDQTWTKPCKCRGTTKWVHQTCLLMWIDLKNKSARGGKIACPQCKMEYILYYPPSNILLKLLDKIDVAMFKVSHFLAGAVLIVFVYWSAMTYGAIVMIQVLGPEAAREEMELNHPSVILLTLPVIPVFLLGFNFFQWENRLLLCLRNYGPRLPLLRYVLPAPVTSQVTNTTQPQPGEEMTYTRIIITSLFTPGLAAVVGNLLFKKSVQNPVNRAVLGFLVMNVAHGVIEMYHKQMVYKKYKSRRVLDYVPPGGEARPGEISSGPSH